MAKVYSNHGDLPQLEREIDAIYEAIDRLDKGGVRGSSNVIAYGGGATAGHVHLHSALTDDEPEKHRLINDAGTSATELWSSSKINTELTTHTHLMADVTDAGALAVLDTVGTAEIDDNAVTNAKADDMPPNSFKVNTGTGTASPQDKQVAGIATATPASGDFAVGFTAAGLLRKFDYAAIPHSVINDDEATKHRLINDAGTSATELWSSSKINTELGGKAASSHVHAATDITSGTLAMARVSSRVKVEQVNLSIADPDASTPDEFVCGGLEYAVTITEVYAYCVGGTSVDFNLYIRDRSKAQDATGETKVFTTDAQATTTAGTKTMNNTAVAADKIVKFEITAKSGSPTWLYVFIRYQVDDS